MAISTTSLLRYIKRNLGASHRPLPIDDEEIIEIILEETVYTFSNYFPYLYNIVVGREHAVSGMNGRYLLDADGLEILGVFDTYRSYGSNRIEGIPGQLVYPTDGMNNQMFTDISSYTQVTPTFEFIPPNIVEVFPKNYYSEDVMVTLKTVHPPHLSTIPLSLREEFYTLALLDVKISLWNILKQFSGLSTAVGNIDLKIEDYEAASSERKDLLERWSENYLKEGIRRKLYIG